MKEYNLLRFIRAQEKDYTTALSEIRRGQKRSHWIPQFKEFAHSRITEYFGIEDRGEAEAYLQHPILGQRIREITEALLLHNGKDVKDIFGELDAGKVRSCMTMFDYLSPNDVFGQALIPFMKENVVVGLSSLYRKIHEFGYYSLIAVIKMQRTEIITRSCARHG